MIDKIFVINRKESAGLGFGPMEILLADETPDEVTYRIPASSICHVTLKHNPDRKHEQNRLYVDLNNGESLMLNMDTEPVAQEIWKHFDPVANKMRSIGAQILANAGPIVRDSKGNIIPPPETSDD